MPVSLIVTAIVAAAFGWWWGGFATRNGIPLIFVFGVPIIVGGSIGILSALLLP